MMENIDVFSRDCMKLPGVLKTWDAYKELKQEIDDIYKKIKQSYNNFILYIR